MAGGAHSSALPEEILAQPDIDAAVIGEGELTMAELVDTIQMGTMDFDRIKGLGFKRGGRIILNPNREFIPDLDTLPMPYWRGLAKGKYILLPTGFKHQTKYFSILTARGCPFNCNFCGSGVVFKRFYRSRSPENIFQEIRWLYNNHGARYIHFVDDTFTIKKANVIGLCRMLIDAGIKITWQCNGRADTIDLEMLEFMKKAGCNLISYGVESGDPQILEGIGKNITLDDVSRAVADTKKTGILSHTYFMVGNLGETWSSVNRTIRFIEELDADSVSCAIIVPFPGTDIYRIAKERGWLKTTSSWERYNTTPHHTGYYLPVMRTEFMSQQELLRAYYQVINRYLIHKIKTKYGVRFYLNPIFYSQEVFQRLRAGGLGSFISLILNGIVKTRILSTNKAGGAH